MTTTEPPPLRMIAELPTGPTHPKAVATDSRGRLFAGCAGNQGGLVCWRSDTEGGYEPAWVAACGRVCGITCLDDGSILATVRAGQASQVVRFDGSGARMGAWGTAGTAPGELRNPQGLARTPDGQIWLVETTAWDGGRPWETNRVQAFSADGAPVACWGTTGSEPGQFNLPIGVAGAEDGTVWIADTYNHRVQAFTGSGGLRCCWGRLGAAPGALNCPQGICVWEDGVLVADTHNNRIQSFAADGRCRWTWSPGRGTSGERLWLPCGVATDRQRRVVVADTMNHRLVICERSA